MTKLFDVTPFELEYEEACSSLEQMCNIFGIDYLEVMACYDEAYESVKEDCDTRKHLTASINAAERISRVHSSPVLECVSEAISGSERAYRMAMRGDLHNIVCAFIARIAATRLMIDEYSNLDAKVVSASTNAYEATQLFTRDVQTNIGWRNETQFTSEREIGEHGVKAVKNRWGQPAGVMEIGIDHTWDTVRDNKIQLVDIAGKKCLTVKAEEITDHDLVSDNVKLFKALVCYTKVPREHVGNYGVGPTILSTFYHFEEKYICVQPVTDGAPIIATGKSESWAIRTMRGRMKKKLFEMLDV